MKNSVILEGIPAHEISDQPAQMIQVVENESQRFVDCCYEKILNRKTSPEESRSHVEQLCKTGDFAGIIASFADSKEFQDRLRQTTRNSNSEEKKDILHFVHIPKTGGMTIHKWLEETFGDCLFPGYFRSDLYRANHTLNNYYVYSGHFDGTVDLLTGVTSKKAVILRDPLDRAISHYYQMLREFKHQGQTDYQNISFPEAIRSNALKENISENYMARCLAGLTIVDIPGALTVDKKDFPYYKDWLRKISSDVLSRIPVVGIYEQYDDFLVKLSRAWGIAGDVPSYRENVGRDKVTTLLSDEDLAFFREANAIDYELYSMALSIQG